MIDCQINMLKAINKRLVFIVFRKVKRKERKGVFLLLLFPSFLPSKKIMRTKLLLVAFLLLSWQSYAIISTLYDRLDARANQIEQLLEEL